MHGAVKVWKMTEEERLAYIEKHPIRPTDKAKKRSEQGLDHFPLDYSWRPKQALSARKNSK